LAAVLSTIFVSAADLGRDVVGGELTGGVDGDFDVAKIFRRAADLVGAAPSDGEALVAYLRNGLRSLAQKVRFRKTGARGRLAEDERGVDSGDGDVVDEGVFVVLKQRWCLEGAQ